MCMRVATFLLFRIEVHAHVHVVHAHGYLAPL